MLLDAGYKLSRLMDHIIITEYDDDDDYYRLPMEMNTSSLFDSKSEQRIARAGTLSQHHVSDYIICGGSSFKQLLYQ